MFKQEDAWLERFRNAPGTRKAEAPVMKGAG